MKPAFDQSSAMSDPGQLVFKFLPLVFLVLCLTGCIVIPTPQFDSGSARSNINRQTPVQFAPGETTRAEVIGALGEPDAVSADESKLAFRSEKICAVWMIAGGNNAAGGTVKKDNYLIAEFDSNGVLQKMERSSSWFASADPSKKLALSTDSNTGEEIQMRYPANWLAGVDGYRPKQATQMRGVSGTLCLGGNELRFFSKDRFANEPPALLLPYAAISAVQIDKFMFGRRLVLRGRAGEINCFEVLGPRAMAGDRRALEAVRSFLESKTNL